MGKIIRNGIKYSGTTNSADKINYNNTLSGLEAETAQEAFDELNTKIKNGGSNIKYLTKAEYEALPDTKLTDGVEYRITDAHTTNRIDATDVTYGESTVADAISKVTDSLGTITIPLADKVYLSKSGNTICLHLVGALYSDFKGMEIPSEYRPAQLVQGVTFRTLTNNNVSISATNVHTNILSYYWSDETKYMVSANDTDIFGGTITWNI